MTYYIQTLLDSQYFPFYEFMWLGMLGLWWSVITRLKRIEDNLETLENNLLTFIAENE
jgi:hypothetical protein